MFLVRSLAEPLSPLWFFCAITTFFQHLCDHTIQTEVRVIVHSADSLHLLILGCVLFEVSDHGKREIRESFRLLRIVVSWSWLVLLTRFTCSTDRGISAWTDISKATTTKSLFFPVKWQINDSRPRNNNRTNDQLQGEGESHRFYLCITHIIVCIYESRYSTDLPHSLCVLFSLPPKPQLQPCEPQQRHLLSHLTASYKL